MATVTTSYVTYATQSLTWYDSYSGLNWGATIEAQAKYVKKNNSTATITVREIVSLNPPSGYNQWYGTNKYYNVNGNGRVQDTGALNEGSPHSWESASFDVSAGSNFNISAYYEVMGNSKTASATLTAPTFAVAPNTPTISASTASASSNSITYGTTSFGTPSTGTVYLYGGTSSAPTTQINSKTTTGNSTYTHSNIGSNTKYYYRAGAYNGSLWSSYSTTVSSVTKAYAPSVSVSSTTATSIVIYYSAIADGNAYSKTLQYSLNNSTWTTYKTISSGSATTGTFTISNLSPNTSYTVYTRVTTTAGTTNGSTLTTSTQSGKPTTPTVSVAITDAHTLKVTYGTTSFGVPTTGTVYLYGGTSSTPTTQLTSKTTTGNSTYTYSNLAGNTKYYFRARAYNGNTYSDYSTTVNITTPYAFYVPNSSSKATLTKKNYVSNNGLAAQVKKLYDSYNGKARRIY